MRILTAAQMREADRRTIEDIGIPSVVLMENAGREVVSAMEAAFEDLHESSVVILAGKGNNGGDGFVVSRLLAHRGVDVLVLLLGSRTDVRGDARVNLDVLDQLGLPVVEVRSAQDWAQHGADALSADIIVDAIVGTGLSAPLEGLHAAVVADVNASGIPVVAIDLPSGMSADRADHPGPHVVATLTVTLGAPKLPLVLPPADADAGTVVIADIGIPRHVIAELGAPVVWQFDGDAARPLVPARRPDSHKGTFGHVLIVAGSRGKTGAAYLAAMGALRSGAGLVTVATPDSCVPIVAALGAEYMTLPLPEAHEGGVAASGVAAILAAPFDVIAAGPGLGIGPGPAAFVERLLAEAEVPLVLDADAVTVLGGRLHCLRGSPGRPVVITPHPGEFARLTGRPVAAVQENRIEAARQFAAEQGIYVVLKGHRTVVASPDGRVSVNTTGNPGMATGGSGDVLTGALGAWLAQLKAPERACPLAVYLHGAAGDLAEADEGDVAMTAGDIVDHLGDALLELTALRRGPNSR